MNRRQIVEIAAGLTVTMIMTLPGNAKPALSARSNGFRMPEESDKHLRTFMQWPVNREVYQDMVFLNMVQQSVADIANTIVEFEPVVMLMDAGFEKSARRKLNSNIEIWNIATDDLWCRDSGPIFVKNENAQLAISQVNFNGWGNKQVHDNDGKVAAKVAEQLELPVFNNELVGEGGGVESDGAGTLMAHESSWVNANRNGGTRNEVGKLLLEAIGGEKIIWAPGRKGEDVTDYHIDALVRFVRPGVVLIQLPEFRDESEQWSRAAFQTFDILKNSTDARGNKLETVIISDPFDIRVKSPDFVSSYVNYYVCNGAVIAAEFGDREKDAMAVEVLGKLYPGREIISLNIDPVGEVGGGIHCTTQQQPA
ncbi:MAG: agmatine deiminase family protein [Rhizobiaceae bacterium]|nr:agmatine deiminase family protein [Rhizobiaceae bacterium]